ncbi:MAG: hypothetical protein FJZ09_01835 [Candidatus Omnitrophica bacterium]|nr:hypothetical protein [Candidatus Omnitrophota bacterium]
MKLTKYILSAVLLILGLFFVGFIAGPNILRMYISSGMGTCEKNPIFCETPLDEINNPEINRGFLSLLVTVNLVDMRISVPKGFDAIQEEVTRVYYKKNKHLFKGNIVYVLRKEPDFLVDLYPELKKEGVTSNYIFLERTMEARLNEIQDLTGAFFVIMKGIFIPDLGDQKNLKMVRFRTERDRGFINYNLDASGNYFDCNIVRENGEFLKVYIRDRSAKLDLEEVFAILSTLTPIK